MALDDWFHISFNAKLIWLDVHPPNGTPWTCEITWDEIVRVCFEVGDFLESDTIYIFIHNRPESFVLPTEGDGGAELWGEIVRRGLFDADLAMHVATADPGIHCFPTSE